MADEDSENLRDRLTRQGEDALGKLAQDLLENPLVNSAITRAFSARERAVHAQEAAMGALNVPSAADIERLTKRLRSVSQRLEGVEERLDGVTDGISRLEAALRDPAAGGRIAGLEALIAKLAERIHNPQKAIASLADSHEVKSHPASSSELGIDLKG